MDESDSFILNRFFDWLCHIEDSIGNDRFHQNRSSLENIGIRQLLVRQLNEYADAALAVDISPILSAQEWRERAEHARSVFLSVLLPGRTWSLGDIWTLLQRELAELRPIMIQALNRRLTPPGPDAPTGAPAATPRAAPTEEATGMAADDSAYRPAKEFLREPFGTYKSINKALKDNSWIRHRRPRRQRLEIHAGDWVQFLSERAADPLDQPAAIVDAVLAANDEKSKICARK
jgi:hypothetical protein